MLPGAAFVTAPSLRSTRRRSRPPWPCAMCARSEEPRTRAGGARVSRRAFLAGLAGVVAAPAVAALGTVANPPPETADAAPVPQIASALDDADVRPGEKLMRGASGDMNTEKKRADPDRLEIFDGDGQPRRIVNEGNVSVVQADVVEDAVAPKAIKVPNADPDPDVHMGIFEVFEGNLPGVSGGEGTNWQRRPNPKSYEDALVASPDIPLYVSFIQNLEVAAAVGSGVLIVLLSAALSERSTVSQAEALPLEYDRKKIQRYCLQRPERVLSRVSKFFVEVARYGVFVAADGVVDALRIGGKPAILNRQRRRAKKLREGITRLGPGVIKLGQAASTRPDIVGNTFASELQLLQDSIFQGFESEEAFNLINQELNAPLRSVFAYIDPKPVAGASLGMVFRAWLFEETDPFSPKRRDSDGDATIDRDPSIPAEVAGLQQVAVKVQRPQVAELCSLDFFIVRNIANILGYIYNVRTDMCDAVDEYASSIFEEMNYLREANNMVKFRAVYGPEGEVYVPLVYPMYSSRRVLTTEWLDLEGLPDSMARVSSGDTRLVEIGIRNALTQCLTRGLVHCDQHSGNLMKLKDCDSHSTARGGQCQLALVDFGICAEIPPYTSQSLACALMHLMHRDHEGLAGTFAGMSIMRASDLDAEIAELSLVLKAAFEDASVAVPQPTEETENANVGSVADGSVVAHDAEQLEEQDYRRRLQNFSFIGVAEKLVTLGLSFPLVFRDYFLSNLRSLAMLEGLAYSANARFNVVELVYPQVVSIVLSARSQPFRAALRDLVVDPVEERVKLISLERLIRLSRPGALRSSSKSVTMNKTKERIFKAIPGAGRGSLSTSVLGFALSRSGRFVMYLTINQYCQDAVSLVASWLDRIVFLRAQPASEMSQELENVSIVHKTLASKSRSDLSLGKRCRLSFLRLWVALRIGFGAVMHVLLRLSELLLRPLRRITKVDDGALVEATGKA